MFFVEGDPKGQPRPRAFAFHGKARVYDPGTAEGWKSAIAVAAKEAKVPNFGHLPLALSVLLRFRRPKSHFGKNGLKGIAPRWHISKPDGDNVFKACSDALKILGIMHDDSHIVRIRIQKTWCSASSDKPGALIQITALEETTT